MNTHSTDPNAIGAGTVVRRKANGSFECVTDEVIVEEPLEIRLGDDALAITMRTPGNDEELAAGFLLSEGLIRRHSDVQKIEHSSLPNSPGNVLNVTLSSKTKLDVGSVRRFGTISTSCGLCGKTSIDAIRRHFPSLEPVSALRMPVAQLLEMPGRLRALQGNFDRTGGVHAAAIFDLQSDRVILREDVGRHNAVDKTIGRALLDDLLPLNHHVLMVSGRASLEIVQKALAAGIPIVASVSAPSTLAINFAREAGQTLIGFLRPPTFNIYSHVERVDVASGTTMPLSE
jgi:FdhD protein